MSKKDDLVSVIIRTKDRPKFLKRAIESVCTQTYLNIELIVVNDGGCDVLDIIDEHKDIFKNLRRSFVYIKNDKSILRSGAANMGLKVATGIYICLLDDDDYFYKNYLSKHIEVQTKNKILWSVSKTVESIENSDGLELEKRVGKNYEFNELKFLFFENYFPINSVVFQKKLVDKVGGFDKNLQVLEDWDMWIKMYLETKPAFIDKVLSVYTTRKGESNVRTSIKSRDIWTDSFLIIMEKYKNGLYKLNSMLSVEEISKFLSEHSKKWYVMKEENQELKDSLAYRIYNSNLYKSLKKGLKLKHS